MVKSLDVSQLVWDKTYCLQHVEDEHFENIHFFGDKSYKGGNDYRNIMIQELLVTVNSPDDTIRILNETLNYNR